MKNKLKQLILEQSEKLLEMADRIFDNPEYDGEEVYASGLLEDYLERNGFQVERDWAAGIPPSVPCGAMARAVPGTACCANTTH